MKTSLSNSPLPTTRPQFNPANMVVIADFDGTVTRKKVGEVRVSSMMSLLLDEKYLSADRILQLKALFATYYPVETDPNMSEAEKSPLMEEWWAKSYQVLMDNGFRREIIEEVSSSPLLQLREGLHDFRTFKHIVTPVSVDQQWLL